MAEKNGIRSLILAAVFGIIGTVIGSVATGLMNAHNQREQQRMLAAIDSFKSESGNHPVGYIEIKQFIDELRNLSVVSNDTISRLAGIQRKYPGCAAELSDRCRPMFVETVRVMREELGSGTASAEDIDLILSTKFIAAKEAAHRMQQKSQ